MKSEPEATDSQRGKKRIGLAASVLLLNAVAVAAGTAERKMRGVAKTVAQSAADAAALAGARAFLDSPDGEALARERAVEFIRLNSRDVVPLSVGPEDIAVDVVEGIIHIRVEARAYGLPAVVAWVFGVDEVVESAEAAAEAQRRWCVPTGVNPEGLEVLLAGAIAAACG